MRGTKEPRANKSDVLRRVCSIGLLISVLLLSGCGQDRPKVRVAAPVRADIKVDFLATGVTESKEVQVSNEYYGYLREILVEKDDLVEAGQTLGVIEDTQGAEQLEQLINELAVLRSNRDEYAARLELKRAQMEGERRRSAAERRRAEAVYEETVAGVSEQKLQAAEASVDEAQAQLRQSRRERERLEELFEEDIASQAQVERAQMEEEIALARRTRAMKELEQLKNGVTSEVKERARATYSVVEAGMPNSSEAELELSLMEQQLETKTLELIQKQSEVDAQRKKLSRNKFTAPIDGRVLQILVQPGEFVRGATLMTLVNDQDVWVEADVAEQDSSYVTVGQEVVVHLPSLEGQRFTGTVESIGAALRTPPGVIGNARFLEIRVALKEKVEGLKPGLEADVEGSRLLAEDVLTVPHQAVIRSGDESFVVVVEGSSARRVPVTVGVSDSEKVEIKGGLEASQQVVLDNPSRIVEETEVEVR